MSSETSSSSRCARRIVTFGLAGLIAASTALLPKTALADTAEELQSAQQAVQESNIVSILKAITGVTDSAKLADTDLAAAAADYLADIGLTQEEADALKANLSKDYTVSEETPEETPAD